MQFLKKNFIGIIFSILFLCAILWNLDLHDFLKIIVKFKIRYLFLFIPLYIINLYLKGLRYRILLNKTELQTIKSFCIFSVGNALNICLPCRFGDFWRAFHTGNVLNTSKSEALGSLITERILDFSSIIAIFIFAIFKYLRNDFTIKLLEFSFFIFILCIVAIVFVNYYGKFFKTFEWIKNLVNGIKNFANIKTLLNGFIISLFARGIECVLVYFLLLGTNLNIGFSATLFVIVFNALSGLIPSVSSYIGAYQYSYILALGIYQVSKSQALAIVTVYEFITLATLGIISLIYFMFMTKNKKFT